MTIKTNNNQSGFALIAVLFSLVILVLLFGSAQKNFVSHATFLGAQYHKENKDILQQNLIAISQLYIANPAPISIEINGQTVTAEFIDVGGLVDLNAASPDLLTQLLLGLDLTSLQASNAVTSLREFHRAGARLNRVSDFHHITQLDTTTLPNLSAFATIHSGHRGIAPSHSPLALLEALAGTSAPREFLEASIKPDFVTPASNTVFHVVLTHNQDIGSRHSAIINVNDQTTVRIIQLP